MILFNFGRPPKGWPTRAADVAVLPFALASLAVCVAVAFLLAALDAAGVEG